MKKLIYYQFLLVFSVFVVACHESPVGDTFAEEQYGAKGAVVSPSGIDGCFLVDPTISVVSFTADATGEDVSNVDVHVSYNGGDEQVITSVSDLPSTVTLDMVDIVSAAGVATPEAGDVITVAFLATTSSGVYRSSETLNFNVGCVSSLAGSHPYVSTMLVAANSATACPTDPVEGVVTFTDLGCGVYGCSDVGFGQYESSCWSDSPATDGGAAFTDVCNAISSGGLDQYGLVYTWTIDSVVGPNLHISWSNDYADSGKTTITKEDGSDWPALFTN